MIKPHKFFATISAVLMIISSLTVGIVNAEGKGFVTTDLLNVRKEPGKNAEVDFRLAKGTEVKVLDTKDEWYLLSLDDGSTGWAVAEYLKVDFDVVQVSADNVNVRKTPSANGEVLTQANKSERYIMLDRFNDWFKIKLVSGECGWVNDDFAKIVGMISRGVVDGVDVRSQSTINSLNEPTRPTTKMAIKGENVNFRANPDLDADIVAKLDKDSVVTVLDRSGEWCRVKTTDGYTGYINKMFLKEVKSDQIVPKASSGASKTVIKTTTKKTTTSSPQISGKAGNGTSKTGSNVISYAKQFMGIRYKWGGTTTKGFDCSGFTQYVMKHFGVSTPRTSIQQSKSGTSIKKADLRTGDLVFFAKSASNRTVNHVGIYIGNGDFIHSSSGGGGKGVTISNLNSGSYARRFCGARRYLK